ncbi:hypothetical protein C2S53_013487 [Perilla frutescens var. hirtella]|uniref:Leucine-rich repeat-containing N-terminal plant-type domain-containing protein n=1 Tax=Perilla frutescens var. hirtella TaxID=608512 RepID=A0AAD4J809_PERFH|nr:hypothetical protein C2S53_013487 [Perilla frutescens var. hirtella]
MMSVSKPIHAVLFLLSIFSIASIKLSYSIQSSPISCPEIEKHSLLTLKQSLKDDCHLLSSWDGEVDCCKWKGVVCNNSTGHVHELRLQGNRWDRCLSGKINPSLINLKHLTYLDLSLNEFSGETTPSFIGSFKNLEYLDLYEAGFQGGIPHTIGNLSNLRALNLGYNDFNVGSLEWLSGLSKLEYLDMGSVNLSRATNWAQVINNLPSLLEVEFVQCDLDFTSPVNNVNLSTSLTFFDLSYNENLNPVPQWFFQLTNLLSLDLSYNSFIGQIPTVSNATKLQRIDLSENNFNSSIPDWIYFCKDLEFLSLSSNDLHGNILDNIANLTSLQAVDLAYNQLSGKLPKGITNLCRIQSVVMSSNELQGEVQDLFGSMSECFLGSLKELKLDGNKFSGHLIDQFGEFKSLRELDLGSNSLSGTIPISLGNLSSLETLFLYDNNFTGNIPESLGKLLNLVDFSIGYNKLEGIVTESHFISLSKLTYFSASGNHITLNVGPDWIPPFQLETLKLGSWSLGEGLQIPAWIQKQRNIGFLDLSNTGISGNIPASFLNIQFLNVSNNNLNGSVPHINSFKNWRARYLCLSSNKFSGSLPRIHENVFTLDLSHNLFSEGISDFLCDTTFETYGLELLHLEGNRLSGELPDCWEKWPHLMFLKLGNNTMSGRIPNSIGLLVGLMSLSLYGNMFSGQIPFSMHKCTNLLMMDLSHNNLDGNLPTWMGTSLPDLRILILHSNKLGGEISSEICHLQSLQILYISNNRFSGMIPRCVCNFSAMATKMVLKHEFYPSDLWGYSTRHPIINLAFGPPPKPPMESALLTTKGVEFEYNTILSLVTNIDLSMNNLSGEIPKELTSLVGLRSLNLSGNHLTGSIPESIGAMKQLESLDLSRNSLSGQIPNGFTLLSSLSYLNLSFNKLIGRIPESTQLSTMEASSFMGNNLCGLLLARSCSSNGDEVHGQEEEKQGEKPEIKWLYVFLSLGYAVGFSAACTALVLKKSWRYAYFGLLERVWDDIYVYFYVKWAKLT